MTAQMIDVGKQIRYNRIVSPETGKTVIVPLDHGIILGPVAGIEDPAETVRKVVAGGASAVIFNTGLAPSIYSQMVWEQRQRRAGSCAPKSSPRSDRQLCIVHDRYCATLPP